MPQTISTSANDVQPADDVNYYDIDHRYEAFKHHLIKMFDIENCLCDPDIGSMKGKVWTLIILAEGIYRTDDPWMSQDDRDTWVHAIAVELTQRAKTRDYDPILSALYKLAAEAHLLVNEVKRTAKAAA